MVDTTTLQPGDKVRIIDMAAVNELEEEGQELYLVSDMEPFIGTVMTVRYVVPKDGDRYKDYFAEPLSVFMEEDIIATNVDRELGFFWVPEMIAEVVSKHEPIAPSTESEIASFLGF